MLNFESFLFLTPNLLLHQQLTTPSHPIDPRFVPHHYYHPPFFFFKRTRPRAGVATFFHLLFPQLPPWGIFCRVTRKMLKKMETNIIHR